MPVTGRPPRPTTTGRSFVRATLLLWAGFWTWFVGMHLVNEPFAKEPLLALLTLAGVTLLAWRMPKWGAAALLLLAVAVAWFLPNTSARWLLAAPAAALAVGVWCTRSDPWLDRREDPA